MHDNSQFLSNQATTKPNHVFIKTKPHFHLKSNHVIIWSTKSHIDKSKAAVDQVIQQHNSVLQWASQCRNSSCPMHRVHVVSAPLSESMQEQFMSHAQSTCQSAPLSEFMSTEYRNSSCPMSTCRVCSTKRAYTGTVHVPSTEYMSCLLHWASLHRNSSCPMHRAHVVPDTSPVLIHGQILNARSNQVQTTATKTTKPSLLTLMST